MEKEKILFDELEQQLDKADYSVLADLAENKDFIRWREIVETFQLKRALNLISGATLPDGVDILSYYRGGHDMYVKMMRIVDSANDILSEYEGTNSEGD